MQQKTIYCKAIGLYCFLKL